METKKEFNGTAYKNQFNAEKYDRYSLMLPKGTKETYKAHAEARGESLNSFIQRAMRQAMVQDGGDVSAWDALAPGGDDPQEVTQ